VIGRWRAPICLLATLALSVCSINLAPTEDIFLAGTEDERDNVLGRLITEHDPIIAFSQRSRKESDGDVSSPDQPPAGSPEEESANGNSGQAARPQARPLSVFASVVRKTLDRVRRRLTGQPTLPAAASIIERAVSLNDLPSLRASTAPIIVGPWLSEVGFELLYWIPFLRWVTSEYNLMPEQIVAVSRGGASPWYRDVAARFVDVFDYVSADEYRERIDERVLRVGHQKQFEVSEFDRLLIDRVRESLNIVDAPVLHPSVMYELFRRYWNEKAPVGILTSHTTYTPLPDPGVADAMLALPRDFVAVRFYFRPSFPDTAENRQFALDTIRRLARRQSVVILNTGFQIDDHEDLDASGETGVYRVDDWMTPTNNLTLQSQIISRASAFVGTYGGLSYLGPYYKVPTMTFYSEPDELVPAHVDATWRLCRAMRSPLTMLHVDDVALVASALDGFGA